ncbi:DNA mismatch repair protein MutL [Cercophora scortea]|uniref:DNA mismatch repair protein MutL n=1 Tax=Cercophora scortea TaxID=314031 RepID=A0AAE0MN78_9PEZI|nr:DNA mismatch repair protein MutL [Cercophora scortea]
MPISALSEDSIRRLGSTIAISTPVTLVKELLDNALDSGATSVDILVSPNTVDKIEVRDNGSGIHPDDFDSLGRAGHTSKLRSFEELSSLGGSSLGFRGVALASTITIAAQVSITTRIATESVATALCLSSEGGIARRIHKSAPPGTTVCVTGLFSQFPVRSQAIIKEAKKTLLRVKELLQAYALARPRVRLHFRVFNSPSLSWSFSPLPDTNVEQAVMQVFGAELVSQCMFKCFPGWMRRPRNSREAVSPDSAAAEA